MRIEDTEKQKWFLVLMYQYTCPWNSKSWLQNPDKWPMCLEIEMVNLSVDTNQQIVQTTNFWN
jgi:hypothetical protein